MELTYSSITISALAVLGGLTLLVAGGEILVSGAVKLASRLGMNALLIGLTVVAFGTSTPELFVSLTASHAGLPEIMLGNVVGSNIANMGLILAISALISPLAIHYSRLRFELLSLLGVGLLTCAFAWYGAMPRLGGLIFIIILISYTYLSYQNPNHKNNEGESEEPTSSTIIAILCLAGFIGLALGSDLFIAGAKDIAIHFGVPPLIIGLTMAAVGTSLPELASCISAIRRNEGDLLVGNIIGSNLFNLLMVMGGTAMVYPFTFPQDILWRDLPVMVLFSGLLIPQLRFRHRLTRLNGAFLLALYAAYLLFLI
ncbi:MAG: calcium/sodium antiporter [Thermodesulfobacteriota bacterium]